MFEIKKELLETHEALLQVEVDENAVSQAMQEAVKTIATKINVPGFRKGKAPYARILQYLGKDSVRREAADKIIEEIYPQVIEQADLQPYGSGVLESVKLSPLTFTIRVPLAPEVILGDYHDLRQDWEDIEVSDQEIAGILEEVRNEHVTLEKRERPAQYGDQVAINIRGTVDEQVIVDEDDIQLILTPETPFIAPGFVEELIGLSADDEKSFAVVFPEDFPEEKLRGSEVQFNVKVTAVYERLLPPLDDALASTVGPFETLADLQTDIRGRLLAMKTKYTITDYYDRLIAALIARSEVRYPPKLLENVLDGMIENADKMTNRDQRMSLKDALQLQGMTMDQFRQQLAPKAEAEIKRTLVMEKFAQAEGLTVTDDEVAQAYRRESASSDYADTTSPDLDSEEAQELRSAILRQKTLERLRAIATGEWAAAKADGEFVSAPAEMPAAPEDVPAETTADSTTQA